MKKLFVIYLLICSSILAQNYKFAWITDLHIGSPDAEKDLDSAVNLINYDKDLQFTLVTGDVAEKGRNSELEESKQILDKLTKPYYIIPGNHDTKWSESGNVKFNELWGTDKFYFEYQNTVFIGVNSGILMRGGGGHFSPEDIKWLETKLKTVSKSKEIFFIVHHPLNEDIDNWYKVNNILNDYNVKVVLCGHGHKEQTLDFNGFPGVMGRTTLREKKGSWAFNIVENNADSLFFYTVTSDTVYNKWYSIKKPDIVSVPEVDSSDFINYAAEIVLKKDLNVTVSTPPLTWDNKVYINQYSGILSCFDTTGALLWDYDLYGKSISKPVISENTLIAATLSGDLYKLDPYKGTSLLSIGFNEPITSQLIEIDYNGSYDNIMLPKETDSKKAIIIGTSTGQMFCYDLETLQELWANKDAKAMIETTPLFYNNKLIFGSWDSYIYCLDSRKGWLIWKNTPNKNFYYSTAVSSPVTDGKNVFVTSPDKNVYSIDINLGKLNKPYKCDAWETIGISNDQKQLFVKSMKDKFYFVSTKSLTKNKEFDFKFGLDTMPSSPIEYNGNVIFGGKNGNVYMIDSKNKMHTLFYMGSARILSIAQLNDNSFVALNMDGRFVIFKLTQDI